MQWVACIIGAVFWLYFLCASTVFWNLNSTTLACPCTCTCKHHHSYFNSYCFHFLPTILAHLIVLIPSALTSQAWVLLEKRSPRLVAIHPYLDILNIIIWLSNFLTVRLEYVCALSFRTDRTLTLQSNMLAPYCIPDATTGDRMEWALSLFCCHTHKHSQSRPLELLVTFFDSILSLS